MKINPATIRITGAGKGGNISIGFSTDDAQYHIWIKDGAPLVPESVECGVASHLPTLYKNPLVRHGHPAYYRTKYLNATNVANSKIVAQLLDLAPPFIEKAKEELRESQLAGEAADRKEAERVASLDRAIARLDRDDGSELQFNDVMDVLDFAKRMRAEGRS